MAWTNFPTWTVGQVSTASDWNTYVAANMQTLATPPILRVYRNSAFNYVSSTATIIPYDTVQLDSASGFSVSTHLYTCPVAGSYAVTARHSTAFVGVRIYAAIYHNVSEVSRGWDGQSAGNISAGTVTDTVPSCSAGDTLAGWYYFGAADACQVGTTFTYMSIIKESN